MGRIYLKVSVIHLKSASWKFISTVVVLSIFCLNASYAQRPLSHYDKDWTVEYAINLHKYYYFYYHKVLVFYENFHLASLKQFSQKTITEYKYSDHYLKKKLRSKVVYEYQYGYLIKQHLIDYVKEQTEETDYKYKFEDKGLVITANSVISNDSLGSFNRFRMFQFNESGKMVNFHLSQDGSFDDYPLPDYNTYVTIVYDEQGNISSFIRDSIPTIIKFQELEHPGTRDKMSNIFRTFFYDYDGNYTEFKMYKITITRREKLLEENMLCISRNTIYWLRTHDYNDNRNRHRSYLYTKESLGIDNHGNFNSIRSVIGDNQRGNNYVMTFSEKKHKNIYKSTYTIFGSKKYKVKVRVTDRYIKGISPSKSLIMSVK